MHRRISRATNSRIRTARQMRRRTDRVTSSRTRVEVRGAFPRKIWIRKGRTGKVGRRRANIIKAEITAAAAGAEVAGVGVEAAEGMEAEAGGDRDLKTPRATVGTVLSRENCCGAKREMAAKNGRLTLCLWCGGRDGTQGAMRTYGPNQGLGELGCGLGVGLAAHRGYSGIPCVWPGSDRSNDYGSPGWERTYPEHICSVGSGYGRDGAVCDAAARIRKRAVGGGVPDGGRSN